MIALPFLRWMPHWRNPDNLRADVVAGGHGHGSGAAARLGLRDAVVMPPAYGLYAAMMPRIVAALHGSSRLIVTNPANAISLTTMHLVSALAARCRRLTAIHGLVLTLTFPRGRDAARARRREGGRPRSQGASPSDRKLNRCSPRCRTIGTAVVAGKIGSLVATPMLVAVVAGKLVPCTAASSRDEKPPTLQALPGAIPPMSRPYLSLLPSLLPRHSP